MKRWIWMLLSVVSLAQTPDPRSLEKIEYSPSGVCKRDSQDREIVRCKWVVVTFGAIVGNPPKEGGPEGTPESGYVRPVRPGAPMVRFFYHPAKCKPLPRSPKFVCKDVWWKELM